MEQLFRRDIGGRTAVVAVTERADGDVHPHRVETRTLEHRQVRLTGSTWVMADEVHGTEVLVADAAASAWPLAGVGDVLMAERSPMTLAVWAADCAPIALFGASGDAWVVVHGGWRGLAAGVIDVAVDALESSGTSVAAAVLGPCIHACCYEFGAADVDRVARGVGASASTLTRSSTWGSRSLDVPAAVAAGLSRRGVALEVVGTCTGCDVRFHSHRRRADPQRHALLAWFEEPS